MPGLSSTQPARAQTSVSFARHATIKQTSTLEDSLPLPSPHNMKPIYISSEDHRILNKTIHDLAHSGGRMPAPIQKLQQELNRATVLNALAIAASTVTLNSRVHLRDLTTDEVEDWVLVMPQHADPDQKRISVLAPVGTAILGFSEGDEIEWETPGGVRALRIEKVDQDAFAPTLTRALYS
jgi:regulator of nucleoside diphosphate kinase